MNMLKSSGETPKAAPPPELFNKHFARMSAQGGTIFCIHPSAEVSGTVRSASVAKMDFPEADIRVIDTRTVGSPLGAWSSWRLSGPSGPDAEIIEARLASLIRRGRCTSWSPLWNMARGGRIGGARPCWAACLIELILTEDGQVEPFEKERTHKRALGRLKEIVLEQISRDGSGYLSVMHAGVPEQGQALAAELGAPIGQPDVPVRDVPPAIVPTAAPASWRQPFSSRNSNWRQ